MSVALLTKERFQPPWVVSKPSIDMTTNLPYSDIPRVQVFSQSEIEKVNPPLLRLQELAYSYYTTNGKVVEITRHKEGLPVSYLVEGGKVEITQEQYNNGYDPELFNYKNTRGFFGIQTAKLGEGFETTEAYKFYTGHNFPTDRKLAYFSSFTPNPLLPRDEKSRTLANLFSEASKMAKIGNYSDNCLVVMADHVAKFVKDSGIDLELIIDAKLDVDNTEVQELKSKWPGYWQRDPKLYRFIPFSS